MEQFKKLTAKLSELFELEKADLDFGIHRIIKARQDQIRTFLSPDAETEQPNLRKIVLREMGEVNTGEMQAALTEVTAKLQEEYGKRAFEGEQLVNEEALASSDGQQWQNLHEQLTAGASEANERLEAEIYSHLTTFFSRYYDDADFISLRRIKAGATPYAVPYSGEEVMLHWANKDQYYIKSSNDLKDYTFTLPDDRRVQFKCMRQDPVLNNNNAKREFHLDDEAAIEEREGTLLIPFHYKIVEKTRTKAEKDNFLPELLAATPTAWHTALNAIPEDSTKTLLAKHLHNYTRKNESDFFIHKHLHRFLNQELDFYLKNEVMHLDDVDEKSADYLTGEIRKIKAVRAIAKNIITFLAQLENFQKKLWLKKKYVTETNYCLTLDRLIEHAPELLETVVAGLDRQILRYDGKFRSQKDEWEQLYTISGLEDYPNDGVLTAEFLATHDKLMLDTVFFGEMFRYKLLAKLPDVDDNQDGLLVHSENFQALNLIQERYQEKVKSVYIDPPYNTDAGPINYKNGYRNSSWVSLIENRINATKPFLKSDGIVAVTIDDYQGKELQSLLSSAFGAEQGLGIAVIRINPSGRSTQHGFSVCHEYAIFYGNSRSARLERMPRTAEQLSRFSIEEGQYVDWRNFRKDGGEVTHRSERPKQFYPIFVNTVSETLRVPSLSWNDRERAWTAREKPDASETALFPIDENNKERVWSLNSDSARENMEFLKVSKNKAGDFIVLRKHIPADGVLPRSWWANNTYAAREHGSAWLKKLFGRSIFSFAKAPDAVRDTVWVSGLANKETIVLDYFGGSGTTAQATIALNRSDSGRRKFILVEQESYFDLVLKPRIQKFVYSKDWKDGHPIQSSLTESKEEDFELNSEDVKDSAESFGGVSHTFKYLRLESYEDALNNLELGSERSADLLGLDDSVREDYLFSYLLDVETRGHLMNLERFRDPWACQLKIHNPHTGKSEPKTIDLVETFSYLIGLTLRELKLRDGFLTLEGENPAGDTILVIWRKTEHAEGGSDWDVTTDAQLKAFAKDKLRLNPADTEYAAIYLNGDHPLEDPNSKIHLIEEVFYERMFEHTGNPDD